MGRKMEFMKAIGGVTTSSVKLVGSTVKAGYSKTAPVVGNAGASALDKAIPALEGAKAKIDGLSEKLSS